LYLFICRSSFAGREELRLRLNMEFHLLAETEDCVRPRGELGLSLFTLFFIARKLLRASRFAIVCNLELRLLDSDADDVKFISESPVR